MHQPGLTKEQAESCPVCSSFAAVLSEPVHRPQVRRVILELTSGQIPLHDALTRAVNVVRGS